jgi:hypothetical protein
MERTIKLKIRARGVTDFPSVDDLLDQVRDYFEILKGVEEAIAEDGRRAIEWRIVRATTNSPISFEAQAFPKDFAVNIEQRADIVTRQTWAGLIGLQTMKERPPYFTQKVLERAERLFERITNGLAETIIDSGLDLEPIDITPAIASRAVANARAVLRPEAKPYKEIGSIEGHLESTERDGWGRPILRVKHRLTGDSIKCVVSGAAVSELEARQIRDIWRNRRVQIYGTLYYRAPGQVTQVDAIGARFLRDRSELPSAEEIQDEKFTGGLQSEEYLARLRDGRLS